MGSFFDTMSVASSDNQNLSAGICFEPPYGVDDKTSPFLAVKISFKLHSKK